jgi:5-dehydro-2-deoxygluconokinase
MEAERLASNRWLIVGRAGLDLYATPPGTRVDEAQAFFPALGGSAANIAVGIASLGGYVALLTTLSDDSVGRFALNELRRYGVATNHVQFVGGEARTSLAVVATRNDDTQSVIYRNGAADFQLSEGDVAQVDFAGYGALIATGTGLASEPSRSATFLAASYAHAAKSAVIFDVDYRAYSWSSTAVAAEICRRFAALADVVVGNEEEFAVMAGGRGGEAYAQAIAEDADTVIYKMGARGLRAFCPEGTIELGVYPVTPLKPTGAGDAFMAGFATGLALGLGLEGCVRRGSAAAAIVVTKVGCAPAMPNAHELDSFLARESISSQA